MDTKQEKTQPNTTPIASFKFSWMLTQLMKHHSLLTLAGWALLVLGLMAICAGILGLTAGALAVVSGAVGISLCAAGGATALLGGVLAGCGRYGSRWDKGVRGLRIPQEQDENESRVFFKDTSLH